jgi:hypothetical protein
MKLSNWLWGLAGVAYVDSKLNAQRQATLRVEGAIREGTMRQLKATQRLEDAIRGWMVGAL